MSADPLVVAPNFQMARLWAQENEQRFTRRPRIVTDAQHLRGFRDVEIVLVQGDSRPPSRWGPAQPPILVRAEVRSQLGYLEEYGDCTVERVWLP